MPAMSWIEAAICRSSLWRAMTSRLVPLALGDVELSGEVLEIGGGGGAMAERFLGRFPEMELTTTDIDPRMVADASERIRHHQRGTATVADSTELRFADDSFDMVVSCLMLHHVIEWPDAIAEACRVLRPGGTLVGYDITAGWIGRFFHVIDRSPHRLIERGELEPALANAGFGDAKVTYRQAGQMMQFRATAN